MAYSGIANDYLDFLESEGKQADKILSTTAKGRKQSITYVNEAIKHQVSLIKGSPKFKLPYGAHFFDIQKGETTHTWVERMLDGQLNLPFETMVLEYENDVGEFIVIVDGRKNEEPGKWSNHIIFNFARKDKGAGNYSFWNDTFGLDKTTYKFSLIATVVQFNPDQLNELNENSPDWEGHMVNHAYFTCLHPLLQLLSALNCSNVEIEDDKENIPSKTKQIMRKSKGKLPLFSYKVLTINTNINTDSGEIEYVGDKGTPKRSHLRRGHIRKYKTGKRIWINSMAVGLKSNGVVEKSYNVK